MRIRSDFTPSRLSVNVPCACRKECQSIKPSPACSEIEWSCRRRRVLATSGVRCRVAKTSPSSALFLQRMWCALFFVRDRQRARPPGCYQEKWRARNWGRSCRRRYEWHDAAAASSRSRYTAANFADAFLGAGGAARAQIHSQKDSVELEESLSVWSWNVMSKAS